MTIKYEYDHAMIKEMVLYMENDEIFFDLISTVKWLYFGEDEVDSANIRIFHQEIIQHAATYAFEYFTQLWNERESNVLLRAEYAKACIEVIPNLMECCD